MTLKNLIKVGMLIIVGSITISISYAQKPFTIKGNLGKEKRGKIRITYMNGDKYVADSATVNNGVFVLEGKISDPYLATIVLNPSDASPWHLTMESFKDDQQRFFLEKGKFTIKGNDSLKTAVIKGGKAQNDYTKLMLAYEPINKESNKLQELGQIYKREMNDTGLVRLGKLSRILSQKKEDIDSAFIADNPDSYLALTMCLKNELKGASIDPKIVEPKFIVFSKDVRDSDAGKELAIRIEKAKTIDVGNAAPEIALKDSLGQMVTLSSLRGKYVLVWFWQSLVMGFEQNMFNVSKVYKKFKDNNLVVLGVSYERHAQMSDDKKYEQEVIAKWKKVVRDNNMNWLNVSDYGGIIIRGNIPISPVAIAYDLNFSNIPQCLLVGPDGTILMRARADKDLAGKVEKIIKK